MSDVSDPADLSGLAEIMTAAGSRGILISGGADRLGRVDFSQHLGAIRDIAEAGFDVIVHTGLIDADNARRLAQAGVRQALIDVIGSESTIRDICGLEAKPASYIASIRHLAEAGLDVVPHIVVGLDNGQVVGEIEALASLLEQPINGLVLVVRRALDDPKSAGDEIEAFFRLCIATRSLRPTLPIALGCMRPVGTAQKSIESYALQAGVDAIAFPGDDTIMQARRSGREVKFIQTCCSLAITEGLSPRTDEQLVNCEDQD